MIKRSVAGILAGLFSVSLISAWSVQEMLNTWADKGIFAYVLPFLLVFALIFGILTKSGILGDNKGVNAIIALAAGLLSLVGGYVPDFFQRIFPYTGIALSVLLAAIILLGLFYSEIGWIKYVIFGVGAIAFLFVVYSSFSDTNTILGGDLWNDYGQALVTLLILGGIIAAVIATANSSGKKPA
jgi:hypothetical protein